MTLTNYNAKGVAVLVGAMERRMKIRLRTVRSRAVCASICAASVVAVLPNTSAGGQPGDPLPCDRANLTGSPWTPGEHRRLPEIEARHARLKDVPGIVGTIYFTGRDLVLVDEKFSSSDILAREHPGAVVQRSCISSAMRTAVMGHAIAADTMAAVRGSFTSVDYSALKDKMTVITTLDTKAVTTEIEARWGSVISPADLDVVQIASATHVSRSSDQPGFYAGAWNRFFKYPNNTVEYGAGSPNPGCTSGWPVSNSGGTYLLTAKHCFEGGLYGAVKNGVLNATVGQVVALSPPGYDFGAVYSPSVLGRVYTGLNETTSTRIGGVNEPQLGVSYCNFGRVSLQVCSTYEAISSTFQINGVTYYDQARAYRAACYPNLVGTGSQNAPLAMGGDSGGPVGTFYSNGVLASAIVTTRADGPVVFGGAPPGCYRWDQKWSTIVSAFGVQPVLG